MINIIQKHKIDGRKFSPTTDEWTSLRGRKYMNVNIHGENNEFMNLGLVSIKGSCNADEMVEKIKN